MRARFVSSAVVLLLCGVFVAAASAQPPASSFDELPARVRVGDDVWVTGEDGAQLKGKLWGLSPSSLEVRSDGRTTTFGPSTLRALSTRGRESFRNGALIGLGVGIGLGAAFATGCEEDHLACFLAAGLIYGGIGAGVGVGIDALTPPAKIEVYRRPTTVARVAVVPVVARRGHGLALRISF